MGESETLFLDRDGVINHKQPEGDYGTTSESTRDLYALQSGRSR